MDFYNFSGSEYVSDLFQTFKKYQNTFQSLFNLPRLQMGNPTFCLVFKTVKACLTLLVTTNLLLTDVRTTILLKVF